MEIPFPQLRNQIENVLLNDFKKRASSLRVRACVFTQAYMYGEGREVKMHAAV